MEGGVKNPTSLNGELAITEGSAWLWGDMRHESWMGGRELGPSKLCVRWRGWLGEFVQAKTGSDEHGSWWVGREDASVRENADDMDDGGIDDSGDNRPALPLPPSLLSRLRRPSPRALCTSWASAAAAAKSTVGASMSSMLKGSSRSGTDCEWGILGLASGSKAAYLAARGPSGGSPTDCKRGE